MADNLRKLKAVEYTRPYQVEKLSRIQLVGDSRWLKDLELLLEDEWKSIKRYSEGSEAFQRISTELPHLVLVEPKAYSQDTFKWVEHAVQCGLKTTIIARNSENMFEWMSLARRAAALDVGGVLFSEDSKIAAKEMSEFLENNEGLKSTSRISEIQYIRSAFQGYQCATDTSDSSTLNELFALLADEFALPSDVLALTALLLETKSLWKRPKAADSKVYLAYSRIERDIADSQAKELLELSIAATTAFETGSLSEEMWNSQVDKSSLGLLSKRKIKKKFIEIQTLLELASGQRTLKIA